MLLETEDETNEAIKCFEAALATYEAILGIDHVSISIPLEKLGSCLIRERRHYDALNVLVKALDIRKKDSHDKDLHAANIYFNLGIIYCETGKLNKAIDCYEDAVNIRLEKLGNESIEVAQVSFYLIEHYLITTTFLIFEIFSLRY